MINQYFDLFQLPKQFDLDNDQLEQRYHALAAQFHPDKFAGKNSFEQKQAMMMATTVNEAYRVLKNPLDRAAYILQEQGIDPDSPEHTHFPPEFLMQQMEWREAIEEARSEKNSPLLTEISTEIQEKQNSLYKQLSILLAENKPLLAADLVRQGRFLQKLQQDIKAANLNE